jgi:hypothetical protein
MQKARSGSQAVRQVVRQSGRQVVRQIEDFNSCLVSPHRIPRPACLDVAPQHVKWLCAHLLPS